MRLLALGGWYGSGNVGDDAILIGVTDLFAEVAPGTEIVALSTDTAQTRATCGVESLPLTSPREYLTRGSDYRETFRGADAVLVTGGTPFYDWDHVSRFIHMGLARRGMPMVCFGVGSKRIESIHGRLLTRWLLSGAQKVSARDEASRTRLSGLSGRDVALTGDSALWMEPAPNGEVKGAPGIVDDEVVVIAPRALSLLNQSHYHDPVSTALIVSIRVSLTRLADELLDAGYRVVFLPMHCSVGDDDRREIEMITGGMRGKPIQVSEPLAPRETAAFLGSASLVVGLRLHSLILAARQGVPVVSVGYDEKIRGFMEYSGVPECVVEPGGLSGRVFELLENDQGVGKILSGSCAMMRSRIRGEAVAVAETLGLC
ncbi:MAG: polysaccharide pyruvyl transferase family protein [Candidatus Bathyarchaeota archaeon]|nr:polysaccharide pyruvyl transferase family protein [Candidatus Bathyarchaeota archaeon]